MQPEDRGTKVQPALDRHEERPTRTGVPELDGRQTELRLLQDFLATAFERGASLLLSGQAGIGKTALLDAAAHAAASRGALVLRAQGAEFEAELPFWGLNQLLQPLTATIPRLGATHEAALAVALGLTDGPSPERAAVTEAAIALVAAAASAVPVLVIIDDPQWLDRSSAAVIAQLAAKAPGKRVGVLVATRSPNPGHFDSADMPQFRVTSLDADASARLLSRRHPGLSARVRDQLLQVAQGNPLALLELPLALEPHDTAVPEVLPITKHLERVFAARVQAVPPHVRRTMLLVALEGTGDLSVLSGCVSAEELGGLSSDDPASLVQVAGSRVLFRHPLMRSTVVALSSGADRAAAHQALAPVVAAERRAWHLAEAATGPDDEIAGLVEHAAIAVLSKGDAVGAVRYLVRSAELSTVPSERARRFAEAAFAGADVTGDLQGIPRLLAQAGPHPSLQAAVATAFLLLNSDGAIDDAHRLLVSAIRGADLSGGDASALDDALQTLLMVCSFGGRKELWQPFHQLVRELGPRVPTMLRLNAWSLGDAARTPPSAVAEVESLAAGLDETRDPALIVQVAVAAFYIDRIGDCRPALWRVVEDGRRGGAIASAVFAVAMLAFDAYHSGRWDEAESLAEEYLELCTTHGFWLHATPAQLCLSLLAAARGDQDAVLTYTDQMSAWAAPRGAVKVHNYVHNALASAACARGHMEVAYWHANAVSAAGDLEVDNSHALWLAFDLVEAAVATHRSAEASEHVAALERIGVHTLSSRMALSVAGARAIAAPADQACELFEIALGRPDADRWPFDLARVHLAYGERLRRGRSPSQARVHLGAALDGFQRLGASAWVERAQSELLAVGSTRPTAEEDRGGSTLTHQEAAIARLAAQGLTNREIADRLRISHRTVGTHLQKVYRRFGVSSRSSLGHALAEGPNGHGLQDPPD